MNVLKSPTLRGTWYVIWLIMVVISQHLEQLSIGNKSIRWTYAVLFLIVSALFLLMMVGRYRHEQLSFEGSAPNLFEGLGLFFGFVTFIALIIGIFLFLISYLKAQGRLPSLKVSSDYLDRGLLVFWFDLLASAFIVAVEQQFVVTGFFFNYFFRENTLTSALLGIIISGILYGLLNMEVFHFINFFIYCAIGCLLAVVYLATQNFQISLLLGIFVAILRVILI